MIKSTLVLSATEDRMELFGYIDQACIEITESQDKFVFGSGDLFEKGMINYHDWDEMMEDAGKIRLVDDFSMPAQYLDVSVTTQDLNDLVLSILKKQVPVMSNDELITLARNAGDDPDKASDYIKLGLGAQGEYNHDIKNILEPALTSEHEALRTAATLSIFLLKWQQFNETLEKAIVAEQNMDLRAKMAYALAFCVAGGAGKGKTDDLPSW